MARGEPRDRRWPLMVLALVGALMSPYLGALAVSPKAVDEGSVEPSSEETKRRSPEHGQRASRSVAEVASKAPTSEPKPKPKEADVLDDRLTRLLREFYGDRELRELPGSSRTPRRRLAPVIVGLPDPTQSHMAVYYDQALVAVRQAAAEYNYVQSHFDLPWQNEPEDVVPRSTSCRSSEQPGLMLFSRGQLESLLLVIFVTESPVVGASTTQLELALALAENVAAAPRIPLVGPFFSGTAEVWADVLGRRQGPKSAPTCSTRYDVVTGSATATFVDAVFEEHDVSFERTVPVDELLRNALFTELATHADWDGPRDIAELRELGTVYGQRRDSAPEPTAKYYFPLNISAVRAQSEAAGAPRADLFPSLRRTLGLKLEPDRKPKSDIPAPLSVLSPFVDDLALSQTLRRICDSRARYMLISATDATDMIFLVQQSRKFCRDLVIVTLGHDSLFLHPDLAPLMAGVLNISAFPPSWETAALLDESVPYAFPSWSSQGVFNALLRLAPNWVPAGATVGPRQRPPQPKIFISEIAGARYWPVRVDGLATGHIGAELRSAPKPFARLPRNNTARFFAWPALLLGCAHAWMRLSGRGSFRDVETDWAQVWVVRAIIADLSMAAIVLLSAAPFWWLSSLSSWQFGIPRATDVIAAASWLLGACLVFSAAWTLKAKPVWSIFGQVTRGVLYKVRRRWHRRGVAWSEADLTHAAFLGACASLIALVGLLVLCFAMFLAFGDMAIALLLDTGMPGLRVLRSLVLDNSQVELRWFRSLEPFAMSSFMPFLYMALAMYGWSTFALYRLRRLNRFPTDLTRELGVLATVPARTLKRLCEELAAPWSTTRYWTPLALLWVFCVWRFGVRLNSTLEGDSFDVGFKLAFCTILLFIGAELVRFVTLSGRLLAFLRDLAAEPMIDAYDRLAGKVSGSFGLQLSARAPEPGDFQISVLTARTLTNQALPESRRELQAKTLELEVDMLLLNRDPLDPELQRKVHADLFKIGGALHRLLVECWQKRAEAPQLDGQLDVTRKELLPLGLHARSPTALVLMGAVAPDRYLWMRAAEDFVALRTSTFIYQVLHELRHTLVFALVASALLAASSSSYPFVPARFLTMCAWSAVVIVVGLGLFRMLALERNEILSRLGGTQPDHVEWNAAFVQQLLLYVVLPLFAAILGLFPGIAEALSAYLSPALRLMPAAN